MLHGPEMCHVYRAPSIVKIDKSIKYDDWNTWYGEGRKESIRQFG